MAIGDPYVTGQQVADRLGQTYDSTVHDALADAASRAVESFVGDQFNTDNVATQRRFRALDCERLPVDWFHTTVDLAVEIDGTAVDASRYEPRPFDGIKNGQPWPFEDLMHIGRAWRWRRRATIDVTAQWGWTSVPEAVVLATLDVAAVMSFGVGGETSGPVRSEAIDGYSVSYATPMLGRLSGEHIPPELRKVAGYRRKRFGVA